MGYIEVPNIDENYKPTDEEINEYADFIGIDLEKYPQLRYLAEKGVKVYLYNLDAFT